MTATTKHDAIEAAMSVADDVAAGKISPADLERQVIEELSALVLMPAEPDTDLHALRIDVARRVLAEGGVPADEQAEWLAVQRRRENPDGDAIPEAVAALDGSEPVDGDDVHPDDVASVLSDLSAETETVMVDVEPETVELIEHVEPPVAPQRGPKFGGTIAARGFGTPIDNGLRPL